MIRNFCLKASKRISYLYRLYVARDPFTVSLNRWHGINGDSTLRLDYPLGEESIVFDVGGYKGNWSWEISKLYDPYIYIFEPVPEFFTEIMAKFQTNPKAKIFSFGLSDKDHKESIALLQGGSSIFRPAQNRIDASFMDICAFLEKEHIHCIDLIKINIEGGEYRLLRRMEETGILEKFRDIQVQFHSFYPDCERLRAEIRSSLSKTHFPTYDYYFVWENWRRK